MKKTNWKVLNRQIHFWGSLVIALPILIVIGSGLLLQVKKQLPWVQPPTEKTAIKQPSLSFDAILSIAKTIPDAKVTDWKDIDRLDVRPNKGVIKIRTKNHWEIQINPETGDILNVAYRRSDLIESIHDGSFFHENAKLWVFLPAAIILLVLWLTGIYLLIITLLAKRRKRKRLQSRAALTSTPR